MSSSSPVATSEKSVISVENLSVSRGGHRVLHDVSFSIERGSTTVIIGPNGSGKTTLLKALMGMLSVDAGSLSILGLPVSKARTRLGYVPQGIPFQQTFPVTVAEVVGMNLWNRSLSDEERRAQVQWALRQVGAEELSLKRAGELSGGQIQRMLIARAIVRKPSILLLDEPATGIDAYGEEAFYGLLQELQRAHDLTVVMVSHDIDVVYRYASYVLCLNRTLVCKGLPNDALTEETFKCLYGDDAAFFAHQKHSHGSSS